jgi:hypothetical protein
MLRLANSARYTSVMQTLGLPLEANSDLVLLGEQDRAAEIQRRVILFTQSVFGTAATMSPGNDPEHDESYSVVRVTASGSIYEILRRNDRWHREIGEHAGDFALKLRLALSIE